MPPPWRPSCTHGAWSPDHTDAMTVLVLAECRKKALHPSAAHLLTAVSHLGPVTIWVLNDDEGQAAAEASRLQGVNTVWRPHPVPNRVPSIEDLTTAIRERAAPFSHIIAANSSTGFSLIPRLAALLDSAPVTDVVDILDSRTFVRPIHAGNVLATVHAPGTPLLLTLRPHAFTAAKPRPAGREPAVIENLPMIEESGLATFLDFSHSPDERPDLTTATVVVAGGRGLEMGTTDEKSGLTLLTELADRLNAAIGASRGAVDAGLLPNDWQIGQTGKVIAPDLYLGVGISGAIQHLAGIKDAKTIVAINKDPGAPLLAVADIALQGDLFEVLPALRDSLVDHRTDRTTNEP